MTEDDYDRAYNLKEILWEKIHDLVDEELENESEEVEGEVRLQLTETFRFWKRYG